MDINKVIGQKVITEEGTTLNIMKIEGQYLQLSNGRQYSFVIAYRNGFIKFKDESLQKEVKEHFDGLDKKKDEEIKKQKELEAEFLKKEMERRKKIQAQKEQAAQKAKKAS